MFGQLSFNSGTSRGAALVWLSLCRTDVSFQLNKHEIHFEFGSGREPLWLMGVWGTFCIVGAKFALAVSFSFPEHLSLLLSLSATPTAVHGALGSSSVALRGVNSSFCDSGTWDMS